MWLGIKGGFFMPKNRILHRLVVMTSVAMMTALSFILERYFPLINTNTLRISLGNVPILLTSFLFGPVSGAICGVLADIIGCFLSGYPPFPFLMLAPLCVGILPGIAAKFISSNEKWKISNFVFIFCTITVTNFFASLILTTIGLNLLYSTPIPALLIQRVPAFLINTAIEILSLFILLKNNILYKITRR